MARRSEEKTDWLGNKYIQHYDEYGNKSGTSDQQTDWLGNTYTQHYDKNGDKSGTSESKKDWLGNDFTQNYGRNGDKSGTSEEESDWIGNKYTQHYNKRGEKSSYSENKKDWIGNDYRSTSRGSGGCFLTTACVEHKGLKDDCRELQVLRNFRDNYVALRPGGFQLIKDYYQRAPKIVKAINLSADKSLLLESLYIQIKQAADLIEEGEHEKAFKLYYKTTQELGKRFNY